MALKDTKFPDNYKTALPTGDFFFVSPRELFQFVGEGATTFSEFTYNMKIFKTATNESVLSRYYKVKKAGLLNPPEVDGNPNGENIYLEVGQYTVVYGWSSSITYSGTTVTDTYAIKGNFAVVENRLPLKDWTVTEVINRLLDTCEPIRRGEKPRFRLNGMRSDGTIITENNKQAGEEVGQAAQFDKVLCPQLAFTKNTLRECLNEVGKVIHGEMRLKPKKDENGVYYFEVSYDIYGSGRMSKISKHKPYAYSIQYPITSFCSALDSPTENLINTLDRFGGVVAEPQNNAYKSVRTENLYVRVTDGNFIIQTLYPIYSISKLEYRNNGTPVDITPYVFESSEYSRLSSYENQYPQAKLYALRFKQGEKNIDGLNFKRQSASITGGVFGDYSIVAILKKAIGDENFSVSDYPTMQFRVTYTPIYNTRVSQTKPYFKDVKYKADLYFNQSANLVETKYYGENLKGVVARLGNVDKAISYKLYRPISIPKSGDMYDENYTISGVAVSYMPTYIDCTIVLSKHFNRISPYIGVPSERRYSEISETQAVERNVLYREYIVIGAKETSDPDCRIGDRLMKMIADTFSQSGEFDSISCVEAWGSTYQGYNRGDKLPAVILPVISSAFGNSISFSWKYADNYSAGEVVQYENTTVDGNTVTGYFQNNYSYTDTYGRIYYYDFNLDMYGPRVDGTNYPALPANLIPTASSGYFSTVGQQPYILRKDSREALQVNVQIDFVTNLKDMIIGSALASYCPAVRGSDSNLAAKLYIFPDKLDKFIDHVEGSAKVKLSELPSQDIVVSQATKTGFIIILATSSGFVADGKSWAIVTNQTTTPREVENDKGDSSTQEEVRGGDVLIARNQEVTAGKPFETIWFTPKREIFDKTVWKDRR